MKKLTIAIMMLLGSFSMASAELGVSIGVSGNLGLYEAAGSETDGTEVNTAKNEEMAGAMGSVFLEINPSFGMLNRLSLGVDYVPHKIQTGTQTTMRSDHSLAAGGTPASVTLSADSGENYYSFEVIFTFIVNKIHINISNQLIILSKTLSDFL